MRGCKGCRRAYQQQRRAKEQARRGDAEASRAPMEVTAVEMTGAGPVVKPEYIPDWIWDWKLREAEKLKISQRTPGEHEKLARMHRGVVNTPEEKRWVEAEVKREKEYARRRREREDLQAVVKKLGMKG